MPRSPDPEDLPDRDRVGAATFVLALRARGVSNVSVLRALETVPRDHFAPLRHRELARTDIALPLACGQTMTAPATVAQMLVALDVPPGARVLELGTGSGYVTALLARLGGRVRSVEIWPALHAAARGRLDAAEIAADDLVCGDGVADCAGQGGFDRILVNGALERLPPDLTDAIAPGGRLVGAISGEPGRRVLPRLVTVTRDANGRLDAVLGGAMRLSRLAEADGKTSPLNGCLT